MVSRFNMLVVMILAIVLPVAQPQRALTCSGCVCFYRNSEIVIDCSSRSLTSVPNSVKYQADVGEINLSGNRIVHISAADFNGTYAKKIDLSNNKINSIDKSTFQYSSTTPDNNRLESLDLHSNELTQLPEALKSLMVINTLDVRDNPHEDCQNKQPINLTNDIMKEMGDTIQKFTFGHCSLQYWPSTISHFQDLQELTLDQSDDELVVIPPRAFRSFQSTLLVLTIKNTKLVAVPLGVSTLRRIDEFHFDNNLNVGNEGVVAQAFVRNPTTLRTLSLINDDLTSFPRALAYIPSLENLDMSHNRLEFISDESIASLSINSLTMHNCNLDRIPGALFHLSKLTTLDMACNNLSTVENNDIQNIPGVTNLTLSNNPIKFISNSAFGNHTGLTSIDLSNTELTTIPMAFNTTSVGNIDLKGSHIDCMCEYVWVNDIRSFEGCCENIEETIDDYINYYVPLCPEYIEKRGRRDPTAETSLQNHIDTTSRVGLNCKKGPFVC